MTTADAAPSPAEPALHQVLLSRGYLRLLLLCTLLGIPVALACFLFVGLQHTLQEAVWETLPRRLGYEHAPWWWPLPALLTAGLALAPIVTRTPGRGGHLPVRGLGGSPIGPKAVPGVVLATLTALPLGVVLGPEAPLMAVGSGLALLVARHLPRGTDKRSTAVLATTGSTAAISTILGGPLVAAVLVVESAALAGPRLVVLLLPCLLASAGGALVFTGFGQWTGLETGALSLPAVPPGARPDAGDFLWGVPVAVLVALLVVLGRRLGHLTAHWTARHTAPRTVACGLAVGGALSGYALLTGRDPAEAALSGQATLAELAADPHAWSVAALAALVLCKGLAWGVCLGAFRGGPVFPALLLGAAVGVACSGLPGLGPAPALAAGLAASGAAVLGLPLSGAVLAALLLGQDAYDQMPLIVVAAVVAVLVTQWPRRREARTGGAP
ncbi:chloride channel protein [Streptomyces sp. JJ38]|uniref:chloride channel protein n=1 Tax=Streptomyces sp. JJ38 TaxID=2738128 RepID=UPI001C56EEBD|nr:chloride channel protein [Streptomyces sp. JJ38]MBW1599933.1 chloride channel protein [Streptomyces sp. JJ38]